MFFIRSSADRLRAGPVLDSATRATVNLGAWAFAPVLATLPLGPQPGVGQLDRVAALLLLPPGATTITSCWSGPHPCLLSPCSTKVKSRSLGYSDGVEFRLPCRPQESCPVYHPDNLQSPLYERDPAYPMERGCVSRSRVTRKADHKQSK